MLKNIIFDFGNVIMNYNPDEILYHCERKIKIDFFFLSNKHRISEVIKSFSQEHCNRHIIQCNDYYQLHKKDDDFE